MLSPVEQDYLYSVIAALIGEDPSIKAYKSSFNENTVAVVEEMVAASRQCNANMKELITYLAGAGAVLSKGWLRKVLKTSRKKISRATFKGYGCLVSVKARWKTAIVHSAI